MTINHHMSRTGPVARKPRRNLRIPHPVPAPSAGDPSDDDLLRYLEGTLFPDEVAAFEERVRRSPHASARIEILVEVLRESGIQVAISLPSKKQ
jgi:hypothetical protein